MCVFSRPPYTKLFNECPFSVFIHDIKPQAFLLDAKKSKKCVKSLTALIFLLYDVVFE